MDTNYDDETIERYGLQDFVRLTDEARREADAYDDFCALQGLDPTDPLAALAFARTLDSGGGTEGDADAGSSPATDDGAPPPLVPPHPVLPGDGGYWEGDYVPGPPFGRMKGRGGGDPHR